MTFTSWIVSVSTLNEEKRHVTHHLLVNWRIVSKTNNTCEVNGNIWPDPQNVPKCELVSRGRYILVIA